jgi:hypothetical protein
MGWHEGEPAGRGAWVSISCLTRPETVAQVTEIKQFYASNITGPDARPTHNKR